MLTDFDFRPVIIIGAARSGTNLLRDMLTMAPNVATWPCDEIPFVWRYGNGSLGHDEFTRSMATPKIRGYIRSTFRNIAHKHSARVVVEKTCANSLRVEFVDAVLPEAVFVRLVRNGVDATASAMKRWVASPEPRYLVRKLRYVPIGEVPRAALTFARNRIDQLRSGTNTLGIWGPRFKGMREAMSTRSLAEICALQWLHCVQTTETTLSTIGPDRVVRVRYEDLVGNPAEEIRRITSELRLSQDPLMLDRAASKVKPDKVGRGLLELDPIDRSKVLQLLREPMSNLGYEC